MRPCERTCAYFISSHPGRVNRFFAGVRGAGVLRRLTVAAIGRCSLPSRPPRAASSAAVVAIGFRGVALRRELGRVHHVIARAALDTRIREEWLVKRILAVVLMIFAGAWLASCSTEKGAATAAIKTAETAWAAAKNHVTKILPDDAKSMDAAIAAAKASLDGDDARAALAAAKDLPAKIQALSDGLAAKETELRGTWDTLNAGLPGIVASVQQRVDALSKSKKLPAGLDAATFDGVKTSLAEATQMWTQAQSDQSSGNLGEAVIKANGVKDLLVKALTALKMPVPAALAS